MVQKVQLNDVAAYSFVSSTRERSMLTKSEALANHLEAGRRDYIDEHIAEDLSLVRLADAICLNPSYLSRLFKQEKGVNLSEYIEETRIRTAKELLGMDDIKVAEVGVRIGYDTPQSFTRLFKKMTGITPQEYRMTFEKSH